MELQESVSYGKYIVFLLCLFFFLSGCGKKEIPTGPPPTQTPPQETFEKKVSQKVQPAPSEGAVVSEVPPFAEEELLQPKSETWVEEHRQRLLIYGRSTLPLKAIFFDFDSYSIRDDMKPRLKEAARYLLNHPEIRLELQGNCDERGSSEYNLALGEKRALAVKRYLVNLGVEPERLETVSFGEERPLDPGHNEKAWALNRRVDLVIIK